MADKEREGINFAFEEADGVGTFKVEVSHTIFSGLSKDDKHGIELVTRDFMGTVAETLNRRADLEQEWEDGLAGAFFNLLTLSERHRARLTEVYISAQAKRSDLRLKDESRSQDSTENLQA